MARAETQPVRLPTDLADALREKAKEAGRSFPAEVESRLRDSFDQYAWAEVEPQLAPRPRALGRLLSLLANEVGKYSRPTDQPQEIKAVADYLVDRVCTPLTPKLPNGPAGQILGYWELRLHNANERTHENGIPVPMTSEQRALAEIRADIGIGQATAEEPQKKQET